MAPLFHMSRRRYERPIYQARLAETSDAMGDVA